MKKASEMLGGSLSLSVARLLLLLMSRKERENKVEGIYPIYQMFDFFFFSHCVTPRDGCWKDKAPFPAHARCSQIFHKFSRNLICFLLVVHRST